MCSPPPRVVPVSVTVAQAGGTGDVPVRPLRSGAVVVGVIASAALAFDLVDEDGAPITYGGPTFPAGTLVPLRSAPLLGLTLRPSAAPGADIPVTLLLEYPPCPLPSA